MTGKTCKEIITNVKKLTKRSKHISVNSIYCELDEGFNRIDIQVTNENTKVVKELYNYLSKMCPFYNKDCEGKWFQSYDDIMLPENTCGLQIYVALA